MNTRALLLLMCLALPASANPEAEGSIDEELTAITDELMSLETDLRILEEDLLYPASSRVAVYLGMDVGELFNLDSVTLVLNGKEVAHHLYTRRQLEGLYEGGIQTLWLGNVKPGKNELSAFYVGTGPQGRRYRRAATALFEHNFEPVVVELEVTDVTRSRQPEFLATVR